MNNNEYKFLDFADEVMDQLRKLDPDGKVYISIGNERRLERHISNKDLYITVLNESEKNFIKARYRIERGESKPPARIQSLSEKLNSANKNTREGIEIAKKNNNTRLKRNINKNIKNKKYTLSEQTKEKIKEFLQKNGKKIGVGITALAVMGTITISALNNRAENIETFNNNYDSIEEVEKEAKGIIDSEIIEAVNESGLATEEKPEIEIGIIRHPGEEINDEIKIIINNINYTDYHNRNQMILREEKYTNNGNIPEPLQRMAEDYLKIEELTNKKNITDGAKNRAIKLLKRIKNRESKYKFDIRESKVPKIFRTGNNKVIVAKRDKDKDEER